MNEAATFWLSISGAVCGVIGMITGIGAVVYARRQAIAAEGPTEPEIETQSHGWDNENAGWYSLNLIVRNRTNVSWSVIEARVDQGALITSETTRPRTGPAYDPQITPLNDLDASIFSRSCTLLHSVEPSGSPPRFGGTGDKAYITLLVKPSQGSNDLSIRFTLEDKAAIARQRKITLKRTLKPRSIIPA